MRQGHWWGALEAQKGLEIGRKDRETRPTYYATGLRCQQLWPRPLWFQCCRSRAPAGSECSIRKRKSDFKLNFGFPIPTALLRVLFYLFSKGSYLNGLIDGFFDVAADIVNLIDTPHRFIRVGNVDGGHIKARSIEARAFAQFLHYLHHDALPEKWSLKLCVRCQMKGSFLITCPTRVQPHLPWTSNTVSFQSAWHSWPPQCWASVCKGPENRKSYDTRVLQAETDGKESSSKV